MTNPFGSLGFWVGRATPITELIESAQAAERLGFGTIWVSGGREPGALEVVAQVLDATERALVGSSVVNMWAETAETTTAGYLQRELQHPGRLYVGAGPSHRPLVEQIAPGAYEGPYSKTVEFLDELDAQPSAIPVGRRLIGAIGPRALQLAAARTLGTIPYNTPPAHTAFARKELGPDAVLAPEVAVVLERDLPAARDRARAFLKTYLPMPNYMGPLMKHGFSEEDLLAGGSDRLIDGLFGVGSIDSINARIDEHFAAGADHVAIQVLPVAGQNRVEVLSQIAASRSL